MPHFPYSSNMLEVTAALSAVNKLVTEDMIPAVIGDVSMFDMLCFFFAKLNFFCDCKGTRVVLPLFDNSLTSPS